MQEFYYGIFSERSRNLTDTGYKIEVRILKEVEYVGDSFIQDANRLALTELEEIVKLHCTAFSKADY